MILVDSNVLVAAISFTHINHREALAFLNADDLPPLLAAAHSHAETFVSLTRRGGPGPIAIDPEVAQAAIVDLARTIQTVAMSAIQTVEAVERYARIGIGARLYDYLIGRTGLLYGAKAIVTFNTGHMRTLFPTMQVLTPGEWLAFNDRTPE